MATLKELEKKVNHLQKEMKTIKKQLLWVAVALGSIGVCILYTICFYKDLL